MKSKTMFTRMILSYSLVMLSIIVLFFAAAYYTVSVNTANRMIHATLSVMSQSVKWIDFSLESLENSASSMENEEYINDFISLHDWDAGMTAERLGTVRGITDQFRNRFLGTDLIQNAYLYSYASGMVMSTDGNVQKADQLADAGWLPGVRTQTFDSRWGLRRIADGTEIHQELLTLVRQIPAFTKNPDAAFIVNVQERKLYHMLYDNLKIPRATLMVLDADGKLLSHSNPEWIGLDLFDIKLRYADQLMDRQGEYTFQTGFGTGRRAVLGVKSDYTGWQYVVETDWSTFMQGMGVWSVVLLAVMLLVAALCMLAIHKISKRIYMPVESVMDMVSSLTGGECQNGDEMAVISGALRSLDRERYRLSRIFQKSRQALKERFIKDLLTGSVAGETQFTQQCRYLDIAFDASYFFVCVFRIDQYTQFYMQNNIYDRNLLKYGMINILEEIFGERYPVAGCDLGDDMLAAVVNTDSSNGNPMAELESIQKNCLEHLEISISIGVSQMVSGSSRLPEAYRQARYAADERFVKGYGTIAVFTGYQAEDVVAEPNSAAAVNLIRTGDLNKIAAFAAQYTEALGAIRGIRLDTVRLVLMNLLRVLSEELGVGAIRSSAYSKKLENMEVLPEVEEWLKEMLGDLAEELPSAVSTPRQQHMKCILACIDNNFQKDISLEWVAEQVGLSPQYISALFKQEYGDTVLNYLNRIRVEAAKKLLAEPDNSTINSIGEMVGFNSVHTFMRVFKKYEGITPGKYRELVTGKWTR